MTMSLSPNFRQRFFDSNGNPLAGGKLYTYQAGTSTPQATYTDSGGGTPNANPVVLDANGEADVWLDPSLSYKFLLKSSGDVDQWTVDNVIGMLTNNAVATASIQDGAVTTAKLVDDAVTAAKLKDDASTDGNRAVTTNHVRDSAITTAKIADANVTRAKLAAGAVANISVVSKAAADSPYSAAASDDLILCNATAGAITVNLPAAAANTGRVIKIKKTDSSFNAVTVDGDGAETIDAAATRLLSTQYEQLAIVSDGSNWQIIERRIPSFPTAYTPALVGFGTPSNLDFTWARIGKFAVIQGRFTSGTSTGTAAQVPLPTGTISDCTTTQAIGFGARSVAEAGSYHILALTGNAYLTIGKTSAGQAGLASLNGSSVMASGETFSFFARVPIAGWEG